MSFRCFSWFHARWLHSILSMVLCVCECICVFIWQKWRRGFGARLKMRFFDCRSMFSVVFVCLAMRRICVSSAGDSVRHFNEAMKWFRTFGSQR